MAPADLTLFGGLLLGLLSSLHCGTMCGGICGSALLMLQPASGRDRVLALVLMQLGRITIYAVLGSAAASLASPLAPPDGAVAYRTLQWAAAVSLMWMGLAMAGMTPRLAVLDRGFACLADMLSHVTAPLRRNSRTAPFALGLMWGACACPMVYGAVFSAALTGSAPAGALFMAGFGLGTVPAVVTGGWMLGALKSHWHSRSAQVVAGVALAVIGFLSVAWPWPRLMAFCLGQSP